MSALTRWTWLLLACLTLVPSLLGAQVADSSSFTDLRRDGNGIAALRSTVRIGFTGESAESALTQVAVLARLNITYDPGTPSLRQKVTVAARPRSAADALLEIATAASLRVRVSVRGQIVVTALSVSTRPVATAAPRVGDRITRDTAQSLAALRVSANTIERQAYNDNASGSMFSISQTALRVQPTFVEPDLLRSIQTMPGIAARSDWVAAFNVRGGEADQTLVLLDGYPVYNPFHLGGVFSTFIEPMVGQVELHTGALPARYGGRLSGVLDVRSAVPASSKLHGSTHVSLIAASTMLGRTFANGTGAWSIGARRTYPDMLSRLFASAPFPYHFQDVQGRFSALLPYDLRFSATAYGGADVGGKSRSPNGEGGWRNRLLGATVAKRLGVLGDSTLVEQRLSATWFGGNLAVPFYDSRAQNDLSDLRLAGSATTFRSGGITTVGYELARQRMGYNTTVFASDLGDLFPADSLRANGRSLSLYANHQWRPTASLLVDLGGRFESAANTTGAGFSPRVSLKYFAKSNFALTAGAGRYTQWLHSLGREEAPLQPLQFWIGSDSTRRASQAIDGTIGAEGWLNPRRLAHVSAFYKGYSDLKVPNQYSDPRVLDDEFVSVGGSSYGFDFLVRELEGGNFSGWMSYTWTHNVRTDDLNHSYTPTQDRPHNLNFVGSWRRQANTFSVRANLASGTPYTPVLGKYSRDAYSTEQHRWIVADQFTQVVMGARNSLRLPTYHRIDASATHAGSLFGVPSSMYLSIVNVFNAKNPAAYIYSFDAVSTRASVPNFPFTPTIGVNIVY